MSVVKRNKLGSTETSDWLRTATAFLGEQISEAVSTKRFFIARRELLSSQNLVTVGACEALAMPWRVLVRYAALVYHPVTLHAALCILFLIALDTDDFLVTWYETLVSYWMQTDLAAEALFMPLLALVLIFLHSCTEKTSTAITASSEVVVMAISAIQFVVLTRERMINKRHLAVATFEASLVPVTVFIRQILGVSADGRLAVLARVGEQRLVTLDAERLLVSEDVPVARQVQVTVETSEHGRVRLHDDVTTGWSLRHAQPSRQTTQTDSR